jgi:hypothetical protein
MASSSPFNNYYLPYKGLNDTESNNTSSEESDVDIDANPPRIC